MNNYNYELLEKVRLAIVQHPRNFDMNFYAHKTPCGTTMCIAGWACYLMVGEDRVESNRVSFFENGREFLGLDLDEAEFLFTSGLTNNEAIAVVEGLLENTDKKISEIAEGLELSFYE